MSRPRPRCPACGAPVVTTAVRGRPRVFCSDRCRWNTGHRAARQRARERRRAWLDEWTALAGEEQLAIVAAELAARSWPG
jgi:hypothetical protein